MRRKGARRLNNFWQARFRKWNFCRREGLRYSMFCYWHKKHQRQYSVSFLLAGFIRKGAVCSISTPRGVIENSSVAMERLTGPENTSCMGKNSV